MKLPVCKLCGSELVEIQTYQCMKYMCSDKSCTLNHVLFRLDQWIALMGESQDERRYRWLRDRSRTSEMDTYGIYIGVDSHKHHGKWALFEENADSAIDKAMKGETDESRTKD